jgi:mono/diheme cytochrome c family protein
VLAVGRSLRRGLAVIVVSLAAGCAQGTAPEVPAGTDGTPDAELAAGRDIWTRRCASCHGAAGGGGRGPQLSGGRVLDRLADVDDHIDVVANGRGGMPAFGGVLDDAEVEAVVRYNREVLAAS